MNVYRPEALPTISATSARKQLGMLRVACGVAVDAGTIDVNPFAGVQIQDISKVSRLPFAPEDYRAMLRTAPLDGAGERGDIFWLILTLMHTGARLGEIVQLTGDDLKCEGKAQYLTILDDPEGAAKRLKNVGSRRAVPLHPNLIAVGFPKYVEGKGSGRIFGIGPDGLGRISGIATKRVQHWVRKTVGIDDPRKAPAHSFRHSFRDIALASGLQELTIDQLLGHAPSSVGRRYGVGYGIAELARAVAQIKFPFSVGHLVTASDEA